MSVRSAPLRLRRGAQGGRGSPLGLQLYACRVKSQQLTLIFPAGTISLAPSVRHAYKVVDFLKIRVPLGYFIYCLNIFASVPAGPLSSSG